MATDSRVRTPTVDAIRVPDAVVYETSSAEPPARPFLEEAFDQAVERISADMPWIMHGSGDVAPHEVDATAAHFLASLTTQYMAKLVDAAVDTFTMFLNQDEPFRVPPPPFQQHRSPAEPHPFVDRDPPAKAIIMKGNERQPPRKKPKRKMREEYWDDPLPTPKIRNKQDNSTATETIQQYDNLKKKKKNKSGGGDDDDDDDGSMEKDVSIEKWVGAIGVDLHSDSVRRAHMPLGLSAPSFVFPICHDVYAYGRVRHIQAAKRASVDPLLQDGFLQEIIQEEKLSRFKKGLPKAANAKADDDDDEEEVADPPSWPDIEELLLPGFRPDLGLNG